MTNLLHADLGENEIAQILSATPKHPLLPPLGSKIWHAVTASFAVQDWMGPLRALAEQEITSPMPQLTNELYREFSASGARMPFENAYFERRRRFARAAICALIDEGDAREKWLGSMIEKLAQILSEPSWALPAHVTAPSGKDPLHIDLFAAETANSVAETLDLFGEVLPRELAEKIRARLREQFFENYLRAHREFFWTKANSNWNAVCHQGVIGAALAAEDDVALLAQMLVLAKKYLPLFLRSFGAADGACAEGPAYWQHGFGAFCALNEQLEARTDGALSLIENDARVRQIACFGPRVTLSNFHFVNFSDNPRTGALNPALLTYLGRRFRDETLLAHGYRSYQRLAETRVNLHAQRTDLFYLTRVFLNCLGDHSHERALEPEDFFFRDLGVIIARSRDRRGNLWEWAAKAGHNAEPHNHNDCGSYLLNINGSPVVIEVGASATTRDFLGENRYQYLAARTLGHSLPIVNGYEQAAGPQHTAKVLTAELASDHVEFGVALTACYPAAANCADLVRRFHFDKTRGRLCVTDACEILENEKFESFETAIIAEDEITLDAKTGVAIIHARGGRVAVKPLDETVFVGIEKQSYRDPSGAARTVNRLILKPENLSAQQVEIGYELEMARR